MEYNQEYDAIKVGELVAKEIQGQLSQAESITLREWINQSPENKKIYETVYKEKENLLSAISKYDSAKALERVLFKHRKQSKKRTHQSYWYVAASIILLITLAGAAYYKFIYSEPITQLLSKYGEDVLPGTNRAYITLADGSRIDLSESKAGVLVGEDGIAYEDGSSITDNQPTQATIHTPNGGQYRVTLSDGTKVTLNSASSLSYPSQFSNSERLVTLTGEAYFEVTRNTNAPFKVNSTNQEIEVLGTSFNVSTYNAEKAITTLVEGSIKLNTNTGHSTLLRPGQQATLVNSKFHVQTVNTDDYTAWMHNQFVFNDVTLAETFAQLERWYDVSFDYPLSMDNERIYAEISRDRKLSEVLNTLEEIVPVTFTISGRRVTVQRK